MESASVRQFKSGTGVQPIGFGIALLESLRDVGKSGVVALMMLSAVQNAVFICLVSCLFSRMCLRCGSDCVLGRAGAVLSKTIQKCNGIDPKSTGHQDSFT